MVPPQHRKARQRLYKHQSRHRELPFSVKWSSFRKAELTRLYVHRYGRILPDDDCGIESVRDVFHAIAGTGGDIIKKMLSWAEIYAPWISYDAAMTIAEKVKAKPYKFCADTIAHRHGVTYRERCLLRLFTIGSINVDKAQRKIFAEKRREKRRKARRRAAGVKPRFQYLEENQVSKTKPWLAEGISRRTWYRRQKEVGTSLAPPNKSPHLQGTTPVPSARAPRQGSAQRAVTNL